MIYIAEILLTGDGRVFLYCRLLVVMRLESEARFDLSLVSSMLIRRSES